MPATVDKYTDHKQAISSVNSAPEVNTAILEALDLPAAAARGSRSAHQRRPAISDGAIWGIVIGSMAGAIEGLVLAVASMFPPIAPTVGEVLLPFVVLSGMVLGSLFGCICGALWMSASIGS